MNHKKIISYSVITSLVQKLRLTLGLILMRGVQQIFICCCLWHAPREILMNIACTKTCLKFSHLEVCMHVVVAACDPLPDASCRLVHDMFGVKIFDHDL